MHSFSVISACEYRHKPYITENYSLNYIFVADRMDLSSTTLTSLAPKATKSYNKLLRRSRLFKVIDFGTNRKPIGNFLLVVNINLHSILHRFQVADYWSNCYFYKKSSYFQKRLHLSLGYVLAAGRALMARETCKKY